MERSKRSEIIKQLKQEGFKLISGFSYLYINPQGRVFNLKTGRYMKPVKQNTIKPESKYLSVPKLVLQAFANQPYRRGQIQFFDGNKNNVETENMRYAQLFPSNQKPDPVKSENLLIAIRCYFQVLESFKIKDTLQTKIYLSQIADLRGFLIGNHKTKYIDVFRTYLIGNHQTQYSYMLGKRNIADTAKQHNLTFRDCSIIVNQFLNILIKEVLEDLENNLLSIQEYEPKPPNQTEIIRQYNKDLIKRGKKPLPLRKKSVKEKLKDFEKHVNEIKKRSE